MSDGSDSEKPSPRSIALRRISSREQSARELGEYLQRRGVEAAEAEETVRELVEEGLIDDRRYARALARDQSFKDKGPMHVANLLRRKGVRVDVSEARQILGEVTDKEEAERVRSILERRYPRATEDPIQKRRAFQAMLRRGFSGSVISRVLGEMEDPEDSTD